MEPDDYDQEKDDLPVSLATDTVVSEPAAELISYNASTHASFRPSQARREYKKVSVQPLFSLTRRDVMSIVVSGLIRMLFVPGTT